MSTPYEKQMGAALDAMIKAAERYCEAYQDEFENPVGADFIIGDEGIREVLRGCNTLLNGPLGAFDGATLSGSLHRIAFKHGLTDENGEF